MRIMWAHEGESVRRGRQILSSSLLRFTMWFPLSCYDALREPNQIFSKCWHHALGLPSLRNCEPKQFALYKMPDLVYFVIVTGNRLKQIDSFKILKSRHFKALYLYCHDPHYFGLHIRTVCVCTRAHACIMEGGKWKEQRHEWRGKKRKNAFSSVVYKKALWDTFAFFC